MDEFDEPEIAVSHLPRLSVNFSIHLLVPFIAFKLFSCRTIFCIYFTGQAYILSSTFVQKFSIHLIRISL